MNYRILKSVRVIAETDFLYVLIPYKDSIMP
jgi:hypothetical protein